MISASSAPKLRKAAAGEPGKDSKRRTIDGLCFCVAVVAWVFVLNYVYAPNAAAAVDEKLFALSDAISAKRKALGGHIESIKARLKAERGALAEDEKEMHEKEVGRIEAAHQEALGAVKSEHAVYMKEKEAEVASLRAEIKRGEEELKRLEAKVGDITVDDGKFCRDCAFDYGNLRTSCGSRLDYLESRHGTPHKEALAAVVEWDPNCLKKT